MKFNRILAAVAVITQIGFISSCSTKSSSDKDYDDDYSTETVSKDKDETETERGAVEENIQTDAVRECTDEDTFMAYLKGKHTKPIIVDFSATWCGPCQHFKPIFHSVANKYADRAEFYAVDIDRCRRLAEKYQIQAVPTLMVLTPDGKTGMSTGYLSQSEFEALVKKNL